MNTMTRAGAIAVAMAPFMFAATIAAPLEDAANLPARTAAAFDRYISETERQNAATLAGDAAYLRIDAGTDVDRRQRVESLSRGSLSIEHLETRAGGRRSISPAV